MRSRILRVALGSSAILAVLATQACATDRPSRNGVFNENQYVRKDFLIEAVDGNGNPVTQDPGWMVRATVTETSTPNFLGASFGIWGGIMGEADLVRFRVTQDKLQMLSMRQLSDPAIVDPSSGLSPSVTASVDNVWPITNVDLKYQVNLDGERTNFYQENQELDWQVRQWVKINFAKNDFSDLQPLGVQFNDLLATCADLGDASATLVTDSFLTDDGGTATDPSDDYMEFTVQVSFPMKFDNTTCIEAYGNAAVTGNYIGRVNETVNLKYSFKRAIPTANLTYQPFPLDEKDPIQHKYGPFIYTAFNRDNDSTLIAAQDFVGRWDPAKPIVWYFDVGFPDKYKAYFTDPTTGIGVQTNALLQQSGAAARLSFKDYNDGGINRQYGDIRYNFIRWTSDLDSTADGVLAVTMPTFDPRTGEMVNEGMEFNDYAFKSAVDPQVDAFLQSIGASPGIYPGIQAPTTGAGAPVWQTGSCTTGATQPIMNAQVISQHNGKSTLFTKMTQYLHLATTDPQGNPNNFLGPQDYIAKQDDDFLHAYFALAPYEIFGDPDQNAFVIREGGAGVYGPAAFQQHLTDAATLHALGAQINAGVSPYTASDGSTGVLSAAEFANTFRTLTESNEELTRMKTIIHPDIHADSTDAFSVVQMALKDSQQCVNGQWESQTDWINNLVDTYWQTTIWHEFGHSMGLEHNFIASVDAPNFPQTGITTDAQGIKHYTSYASSIMEYNIEFDRVAWTPQWLPYDAGAITWIYANYNGTTAGQNQLACTAATSASVCGANASCTIGADGTNGTCTAVAISGQVDNGHPWNDPNGFDSTGKVEHAFLFCDEKHEKYSPLCRPFDAGSTPSEIIANAIDLYEWQYPYRNTRNYHKVWNASGYQDQVEGAIVDLKRFLSMWAFDWSSGEIATTLYRIGVTPPADAPSAQNYYAQLTQKFLKEMSMTNQMVAAFHEAIIQQGSGERPFATVYDKYYGDEVQQGIILDKQYAMQNWVGLWEANNYDQNQAGAYISSWGDFGESSYQSISEAAVTSMIGSQYAVYPYFIPAAVALFAQDTHNPAYLGSGRVEAKDWIGGQVFPDISFFVNYFKELAVTAPGGPCNGMTYEACTYDPTQLPIGTTATQSTQGPDQTFIGPDGITYVWTWLPSRNEYVVARQDRNIATFKLIQTYNVDLLENFDDGSGGAYSLEYPIKYTIDSYKQYD